MTTKNDDFWGDQADWPEVAEGARREPRAGAGKTVSRWWNKAVSGGSTANRAHGGSHSNAPVEDLDDEPLSVRHSGEHPVVHRAPADPARPTPPAALGAQHTPGAAPVDHPGEDADDAWDADWEVEPAPASRPGIDPLLARIGGAAIVLTLLVPLVLGFGSGDDDPTASAGTEPPTVTLTAADDLASTAPSPTPAAVAAAPSSAAETTATTNATTVAATVTATAETSTPAVAAAEPSQASAAVDTTASASVVAERVEQSCAIDYTVVAGDFWIRLANAAGVPIAQLLDANDATSDTPLFPGSVICLPEGASVPSPPTTAAPATIPPTTARPVATTTPPTTPPRTTTPPTTAPPVVTYPTLSAAVVQQVIRDVWPDDLEERAIQIADRESNFVTTAQNSCCYGIFQIHWTAHQGWLSGLGITAPQQLFDPTVNAQAAYVLYQRAGGWGPWT